MGLAINHAVRNAPASKPYAPWIQHLWSNTKKASVLNGEAKPSSKLELEIEAADDEPGPPPSGQMLDLKEALGQTNDAAPTGWPSPQAKTRQAQNVIVVPRELEIMDSLPSHTHTTKIAQNPPEPSVSKLDELKAKAATSLHGFASLLKAIKSPLPTDTGDGSQTVEAKEADNAFEKFGALCKDAASVGLDTLPKLLAAANAMANGEPIDDKKYYMEALVEAASKLPAGEASDTITDKFLTTLWNDLEHPPQTLLGDDYQYRQPDGSKNSYQNPNVGAAGMPYARTVAPKTMQLGALPDPGVLFDTLMARKQPTQHPNRISSMLFYLASIIIHDVFRTDHADYRKSNTSSYLDLAPLYGSSWKDQKRMRTMKDGKIKPDCFAESRLLSLPAGVGAILIMFNRYHNYVVEQLAAINEGGRFSPSDKTVERYDETLNKRDDDLFQTGRLIVCGLYVNIILIDYVRTILNLNRTDSNWQLNPRKDIPGGPPKGTGNQVSAEFNLVYRWHSSISTRDELWTEALSAQLWGGEKSMADVPQYEIIRKLSEIQAKQESQDPDQRQFPALDSERLERYKDGPYKGSFKDDDIAKILTDSIDDCANAMGPQQVPVVLRAIEILGIQQTRTWKLATLNEFRKHFKLEPHKKFSDITSNVEVADALKHLYDTPDNVELYPGLVVEDAKDPKMPGSGLCPSYTTSRGVLSDAVALVRGDRFYTSSYTPASLTNWGYQEVSSDSTIDNGCVFYKLFTRALPNNYDPASVYVHYPMTIPSETRTILRELKKDHRYNFDRPAHIPHPTMIFSYATATKVMNDQDTFKVTWGKAMEFLMGPEAKDFMLAGDNKPNTQSRELMEKAMYQGESSRGIPKGNEKWLQAVRSFYETTTLRLLKSKAYKLGKLNQVDIIRDIGNMAHVHFSAELFNLPLKTEAFPHGVFTESQLYLIMTAVFTCIFFDVDPAKSFTLRQQAYDATRTLGNIIVEQVKLLKLSGERVASAAHDRFHPTSPALKDYGVHMISQLLKSDPDIESLVWGNIMGVAGGMVTNQGQLFAQSLDYLFSKEGSQHLTTVTALAKSDRPEDFDKLTHYFMEFSRLNGETGLFREVVKPTTLVDNGQTYNLKVGDRLMVNLKAASRDPAAFPNPDTVDPTRPLESYIHLGHGPHQCLGLPMVRVSLTTMLRTVLRECPNLRPATVSIGRASGPSEVKKMVKEFVPGDLAKIPESWHFHAYLTEDWDMLWPFPTSLKMNWDSEAGKGVGKAA